ncbi:hypothetical protein EJD97_016462, partial [Solanum chilense]
MCSKPITLVLLHRPLLFELGPSMDRRSMLPLRAYFPWLIHPDDVVFGEWVISNMNLADDMARANVFDIDLQKQLRPYMESMVPFPVIYDPDFIAANQGSRANNVIKGTKKEQVDQIIKDIRDLRKTTRWTRWWSCGLPTLKDTAVWLLALMIPWKTSLLLWIEMRPKYLLPPCMLLL